MRAAAVLVDHSMAHRSGSRGVLWDVVAHTAHAARQGAARSAHLTGCMSVHAELPDIPRVRRFLRAPSKSPLPGGFWVFLGSSRKGYLYTVLI